MRKLCGAAVVLWFSLIVLAVRPPLHSQTFQFKRGQAVYVFAARDSHLLTMNPTLEEVKFPTGKTWKSDGSAHAHKELFISSQYAPYRNQLYFALDEGLFVAFKSPNVFLPLPSADVEKALSAMQLIPRPSFLDRITPDPKIKDRIEKEFRKQGQYIIADSPAQANLVFLAEAAYIPAGFDGRTSITYGDYKAEYLQSVFGIVVPAAAFDPYGVKSAELIATRLWEGSSIMRWGKISTMVPASPESVAAQFHDKEKRNPDQYPLCAASLQLLSISTNRAAPILKTNSIPSDASQTAERKSNGDSQAIRVDISMVMVPVIGIDRDGNYISDLSNINFRVFEDNVEQKIDRIITETVPLDLAFMVDTSHSMRFGTEEIQVAAQAFSDAIRPQDRLMIVSFDNRIIAYSELTADKLPQSRAISRLRPGEGTRLYDALRLVLEDRLDVIRGRKAIVILTDGVDTRSRISGAQDTLAAFEESNALVYAIQYDTSKETQLKTSAEHLSWVLLPEDARDNTERYRRADKYLFNLCNTSGGSLYVAQKGSDLSKVYADLAEQTRHQYVLCYYSNAKQDGAYHRIKVEVDRPGVRVRARTGYRASSSRPK